MSFGLSILLNVFKLKYKRIKKNNNSKIYFIESKFKSKFKFRYPNNEFESRLKL